MKLKFTKMQGLGNDFVVLDFTKEVIALSPAQATRIADRHFGVGCDQILIVEKSKKENVDFKYRILNADGSEVGQCGNGARCFVRYVHEKGLSTKNPIVVETMTGEMTLIPLDMPSRQNTYQVDYQGQSIDFSALSIGNPHAVILVDDVCSAPVLELGAALEPHPLFPEKANIGFMQINSRSDINLRVFERGSGETIACGSGTCAAVASGIINGKLDNNVTAHLTGGDLQIEWAGEGSPVMMTGPANTSFEGELTL